MKSQTRAATIAAASGDVFAYVSEPRNLPQWVPAFANAVEERGDHWTAITPDNALDFRLRSDREFGVVDFLVRVGPDRYVLTAPTRVVPSGRHETEYLFTLFAIPGEDDARFEARLNTVEGELKTLQHMFERTPVH